MDALTLRLYTDVSETLATRVKVIFATEESLQATYGKYFSALPFDRTERWDTILRRELRDSWKEHMQGSMTLADERAVLLKLAFLIDYNLFTQVLLNVQPAGLISYRGEDATKKAEQLQAKWVGKSPSPFDPKPKMFKTAASPEQAEFNRDLSTVKALRTIQGMSVARSFRVSAMGSTPALTDSANLSMLGIGGDQYLAVPPGFSAHYYSWDTAPGMAVEDETSPKQFHAAGVTGYRFESKSGNADVLNAALYARFLAFIAYTELATDAPDASTAVLPRMGSLLVVTNADAGAIDRFRNRMVLAGMGVLRYSEGSRPDTSLPEAA